MGCRSIAMRILLVSFGLTSGCASDGTSKSPSDVLNRTVSSIKPHVDDRSDSAKDDDDQWNEVGRQARADRKVESENDPLRNIFVSPQAQEIERSLGVN
jgi:hypothetical protein